MPGVLKVETSPGTWVPAGIAAIDPKLPIGIIAYAQTIANQASITTIVDLTGVTVTFTATSGRYYKVTGFVPAAWSTVAADSVTLSIRNASNTQLQSSGLEYLPVSGAANAITIMHVNTTLSGSTTLKLSAARGHGTGTITIAANAGSPTWILVEDMGIP